ncbi:MAG: hypothetical protein U0105_02465 [Candidatus Obscuribacterales bacterium]
MRRTGMIAFSLAAVIGGCLNFAAGGVHRVQADEARPGIKLQGGVEFSDKLKALPEDLHEGGVFQKQRLAGQPQVATWYRIPRALAGVWQRESQLTATIYDFKSGQLVTVNQVKPSRTLSEFGLQRDKLGDIWDMRALPFTAYGDSGNILDVQYMRRDDLKLINETSAATYNEYLEVMVDKRSMRIVQSSQVQAQCQITAHGRLLKYVGRLRTFDQNGMPLQEETTMTQETLVQPFEPMDKTEEGEDLRASFVNFLRANGLKDRIPDS